MRQVNAETQGWFAGRIPDDWFAGPVEVTADREEILVVGRLAEPEASGDDEVHGAARRSRVEHFREETRAARMKVAEAAEERFGRKVAWAVDCGEERFAFTSVSVPVMTRLRMDEREVLDTLVDASVARSRSDALAWCVRLVGRHQSEWIADLQEALTHVEEVRRAGPTG